MSEQTVRQKTFEQKVDLKQHELMAAGYSALDAYERAKFIIGKRQPKPATNQAFVSCRCPAGPGEPCTLSPEGCAERVRRFSTQAASR